MVCNVPFVMFCSSVHQCVSSHVMGVHPLLLERNERESHGSVITIGDAG